MSNVLRSRQGKFASRIAAMVLVAAGCAASVYAEPKSDRQGGESAKVKETAPAKSAFSYVRVEEEEGGAIVKLQTAVREFKSEKADAPTIYLVGAVHIGDKGFYEALQASLDSKDVVLFEGVRPPGAGRLEHQREAPTDTERAALTEKRLRLLMISAEVAKEKLGHYPATMDELHASVGDRLGRFSRDCAVDAWGQAIALKLLPEQAEADKGRVEFVSLGSDGLVGGEKSAADLSSTQLPPVKPEEVPKAGDEGIQKKLARALGLVFQLDAMKHEGENWRSSDLSADQVQDRLEAAGADASGLFNMLSGSSFSAKLAGILLNVIASNQMLSTVTKVAMIDMLTHADRLLAGGGGGGAQAEQLAKAMTVIIHDRNEVVEKDLRNIVTHEPNVKTIAVIYGAGHMADLEERVEAMGYAPTRDVWFTAIRCDVRESGLSLSDVNMMRKTVRQSIESAIEQNERRSKRASQKAQPAKDAGDAAAPK